MMWQGNAGSIKHLEATVVANWGYINELELYTFSMEEWISAYLISAIWSVLP